MLITLQLFLLLVHRILSNCHIDLSDFFICCVVVGRRSHRYASFLRLAYEEIILRQYSRYLIFDVLAGIRACLKNHSRNLHAPLCGRFHPNSVAVARYGALIRAKFPTNCDAHLAESLFQTRSREPAGLQMDSEINSCAQIAEVLKYIKIT